MEKDETDFYDFKDEETYDDLNLDRYTDRAIRWAIRAAVEFEPSKFITCVALAEASLVYLLDNSIYKERIVKKENELKEKLGELNENKWKHDLAIYKYYEIMKYIKERQPREEQGIL